jgi:large subunit ribosomal protein L28
MARECQLTGKRTTRGNTYAIRGIAKKKKGIGLKVTGKTRRTFKPNLVEKRVWVPEEKRFVTLRISTQALRTMDKIGVSAAMRKIREKAN